MLFFGSFIFPQDQELKETNLLDFKCLEFFQWIRDLGQMRKNFFENIIVESD
jgi:hypothetical protein